MGAHINIAIRLEDGRRLHLAINEDWWSGAVKRRIEALEHIPVYQQQLSFRGETLDDDRALSSYGIQEGSVLTFKHSIVISVCLPRQLHVHEDTFNVVRTHRSDLVGDLKAEIAELMDVCTDQLEIVYQRKPLKDDWRLGDCGICDLCTVDVFKKFQSKIVIKSLTDQLVSETIEVRPTDTVVDIKRTIRPLVGVPPHQLHLINTYDGELLNDVETLSSCMIWEGSTLMFVRKRPTMLTVKGGAGEVLTLVFSPWDRVRKLKADIYLKMGISHRDEIRLFCRKKEENYDHTESSVATENINAEFLSRGGFVILYDCDTLRDYNIQDEDILYLVRVVRISVKSGTGGFIGPEVNS